MIAPVVELIRVMLPSAGFGGVVIVTSDGTRWPPTLPAASLKSVFSVTGVFSSVVAISVFAIGGLLLFIGAVTVIVSVSVGHGGVGGVDPNTHTGTS